MDELNRIINLPLTDLQRLQQLEQTKLRILQSEYKDKCKEYNELGQVEYEEFHDELIHIDKNIFKMKSEIDKMNQECRLLMAEKKNRGQSIKQFQLKRNKLLSINENQSLKLAQITQDNFKIENEIRIARQEYQFYQQEIYNLGVRADNIKKYGCQFVPETVAAFYQERESLLATIASLQQLIKIQEQEFNQMVEQQDIEQLQQQIIGKEKQKMDLQAMENENKQLLRQNERLNRIKLQYEWNPNLEIKSLEMRLQQQEVKISNIEKQNSWITKKSNEYQQKINEYKKGFKKQNKDVSVSQANQSSQCKLEQNSYKKKGSSKRSLYDSIKQDIEEERTKDSFLQKIKHIFCRKQKQKNQSDTSARTFRKVKTTNIVQFWIVIIILSAVTFYYFRSAKK